VSHTGDTSTSQMSQRALALRFLTRTQAEVAQMRACLPEEPLVIEQAAVAHIERLAHKISSGAEVFGFPEIDAIAGAIELMAQERVGRTVRDRLALCARLTERVSALSVYVEYELAENEAKRVPDELPMSAHLPGFGARRK
jgi:HPt (histidine-containing phosphotransfer) domain-containing protein